MPRVSLLLLQAASATSPSPDAPLLRVMPSTACHASATEIVVCGKDADAYRLPKAAPPPGLNGPPKAEWGLGGDAKMGVHGSQRTGRGAPDPAAMVTVTIPF